MGLPGDFSKLDQLPLSEETPESERVVQFPPPLLPLKLGIRVGDWWPPLLLRLVDRRGDFGDVCVTVGATVGADRLSSPTLTGGVSDVFSVCRSCVEFLRDPVPVTTPAVDGMGVRGRSAIPTAAALLFTFLNGELGYGKTVDLSTDDAPTSARR